MEENNDPNIEQVVPDVLRKGDSITEQAVADLHGDLFNVNHAVHVEIPAEELLNVVAREAEDDAVVPGR